MNVSLCFRGQKRRLGRYIIEDKDWKQWASGYRGNFLKGNIRTITPYSRLPILNRRPSSPTADRLSMIIDLSTIRDNHGPSSTIIFINFYNPKQFISNLKTIICINDHFPHSFLTTSPKSCMASSSPWASRLSCSKILVASASLAWSWGGVARSGAAPSWDRSLP